MEIRNCLFCGKEFEAKSNKHKCCCKSHADKYLRKQAGATYTERASLDDRNKRIIELAKSGLSCEEIKQELNLKLDYRSIYSILQKNGVKAKQKRERKKKSARRRQKTEIMSGTRRSLNFANKDTVTKRLLQYLT